MRIRTASEKRNVGWGDRVSEIFSRGGMGIMMAMISFHVVVSRMRVERQCQSV